MDVPIALGLARDRREAAVFLAGRGLIPTNNDCTTWSKQKTRRETKHEEIGRELERMQMEADFCEADGGEVVSIIDRHRVMRQRPDLYTAQKWQHIMKQLNQKAPDFDRSLISVGLGLGDVACDIISRRLERDRRQHLLP